jgi:hypothetical protein
MKSDVLVRSGICLQGGLAAAVMKLSSHNRTWGILKIGVVGFEGYLYGKIFSSDKLKQRWQSPSTISERIYREDYC